MTVGSDTTPQLRETQRIALEATEYFTGSEICSLITTVKRDIWDGCVATGRRRTFGGRLLLMNNA